jgi:hypothetical protein
MAITTFPCTGHDCTTHDAPDTILVLSLVQFHHAGFQRPLPLARSLWRRRAALFSGPNLRHRLCPLHQRLRPKVFFVPQGVRIWLNFNFHTNIHTNIHTSTVSRWLALQPGSHDRG